MSIDLLERYVGFACAATLFACGAGDGNRTRTVSLGTACTHGVCAWLFAIFVVLSGLECPLDACRNGTLMARRRRRRLRSAQRSARRALETGGARLQRTGSLGCLGDLLCQQPTRRLLPGGKELALVREVPEEGALGDPSAFGDLRNRRGVVPLLGEQVDGSQNNPLASPWFPPCHTRNST